MTTVSLYGEEQPHGERQVARVIEDRTARLPLDTFLWGAFAAVARSLALQLADRRLASLFVGQWVPTLLMLGLYNEMVKVAGSDRPASPGR